MPNTPQSLVIDPQGVEYDVSFNDVLGADVDAYVSLNGASPISQPYTISDETTFYFASGAVGHERNATPVVVSAKFNGIECAGPDSETMIVYAQNWQPGKLIIELGNGSEELAALLAAGVGGLTAGVFGVATTADIVGNQDEWDDPALHDTSVNWITLAPKSGAPAWAANTAFDTDGNHFAKPVDNTATASRYVATANVGTSGSDEPAWDGGDKIDGELSWTRDGGIAFLQGGTSPEWIEGDVDNFTCVAAAGFLFVANTNGHTGPTEPDWASAPNYGDSVDDPNTGFTWQNNGPIAAWQADHDYTLVDPDFFGVPPRVWTSPASNIVMRAYHSARTTAESGATEPDWTVLPDGQNVIDGEIAWEPSAETVTINSFADDFAAMPDGRNFWLYNPTSINVSFNTAWDLGVNGPGGAQWVTFFGNIARTLISLG